MNLAKPYRNLLLRLHSPCNASFAGPRNVMLQIVRQHSARERGNSLSCRSIWWWSGWLLALAFLLGAPVSAETLQGLRGARSDFPRSMGLLKSITFMDMPSERGSQLAERQPCPTEKTAQRVDRDANPLACMVAVRPLPVASCRARVLATFVSLISAPRVHGFFARPPPAVSAVALSI